MKDSPPTLCGQRLMTLLSAIREWAGLRPEEIKIVARRQDEVLATTLGLPLATVDLSLLANENYDHAGFDDNQCALAGMAAYAVRLLIDEGVTLTIGPREVRGAALEVTALHPDVDDAPTVIAMQFYDAVIMLRPMCLKALNKAERS